ncbi:rRNA adenine N-6-methyltransferase family protein [Brevibacillus fulvus]|uniref:rRNA adenine N-6-methyltransferase n=1 Tax=Brevibacillus fulvus TaxID=1125967 RepID=A0A939BNY0_9BACL|nr:phospholipid N-methyltransferase [Brevibacillus fulvus]
MTDFIFFLRRFISAPGRVGSVIPSSRFLAERMLKEVNWEKTKAIVELGPGTGVFTKEILEKKRPATSFFAVERDPQFRRILQARFPPLRIYEEAGQLSKYLRELDLPAINVIVSGLPFAVFPPELRTAILDEVDKVLAPDGIFITFQYSLQMRAELKERFRKVKIGFTPLNIPPAFIYTCYK